MQESGIPSHENDNGLAVILFGAASDCLKTSEWLKDITVPSDVKKIFVTDQMADRAGLLQAFEQTLDATSLLIFCGHGVQDALLGSFLGSNPQGRNDVREINGKHFSVIYSTDPSDPGPNALFAFCCNAANDLGAQFPSAGRTFLGYTKDIPFMAEEKDNEILKEIFRELSASIIRDRGVLPKHEELAKQLYDKANKYYEEGEGMDHPLSFVLAWCLATHRDAICRFGN